MAGQLIGGRGEIGVGNDEIVCPVGEGSQIIAGIDLHDAGGLQQSRDLESHGDVLLSCGCRITEPQRSQQISLGIGEADRIARVCEIVDADGRHAEAGNLILGKTGRACEGQPVVERPEHTPIIDFEPIHIQRIPHNVGHQLHLETNRVHPWSQV